MRGRAKSESPEADSRAATERDMSTSDRTINQVRAILSKLDRSIDEARERRKQPAPPPPAQAQVPAPPPPAAQPVPQPSSPGSAYGRAQPLQRPQASPIRWGK